MAAVCFDRASFSADDFNAAKWVEEHRTRTTLSTLQSDLSAHDLSLRASLRDAMCAELPRFGSLSANISSAGKELSRLSAELAAHRDDVTHSASSVADALRSYSASVEAHARLGACIGQLRVLRRLAEALHHAEALLGHRPGESDVSRCESDELPAEEAGRLLSASIEYSRLAHLRRATAFAAAARASEARAEGVLDALLRRLRPALDGAMRSGDHEVVADVLRAFVEVGQAEQAEAWLCGEWVAPRLLPRLEAAAAADEPLVRLIEGVDELLRSDAVAPLLQPAVAALPLNLPCAIWAQICQFVMKRMPHVFGAGIPQAFHTAYLLLTGLQARFEALLPSASARRVLRAHVATVEFSRKLNLPIYFQLRVQQISKRLDAALTLQPATPAPPPRDDAKEGGAPSAAPADPPVPPLPDVRTPAALALAEAVLHCFSPSVFLKPLASRLLRLALQTIGRFSAWLLQLVPPPSPPLEAAVPSSPLPPDAAAPSLHSASHDLSFEVCVDASTLVGWLTDELEPALGSLLHLPEAHPLRAPCAAALREATDSLAAAAASLRLALIGQQAAVCSEPLAAVRGIPALYRMTGKPLPTAASGFVARVFQLFSAQLQALGRAPAELRTAWARAVAAAVTQQYLSLTVATLEKVANDEQALRRHIASKRPAAMAQTGGATDSDKIRAQLCLDVDAYGEHLTEAGIAAESLAAFEQLREAVRPAASVAAGDPPAADVPIGDASLATAAHPDSSISLDQLSDGAEQ
ncbi:hypothetical protein AB1Y20_002834 [Prymnesium parvum]|uniref:Conserved oligomeric Golgi complex subunit 2 n=1 Tax=Prymnesium parvum TaxID=97485 RepID=A0AB34JCA5_PRYPA